MRFSEMQKIQQTCNSVVELLYKMDKNLLQFKSSNIDDTKKLEDILNGSNLGKKFTLDGDNVEEIKEDLKVEEEEDKK